MIGANPILLSWEIQETEELTNFAVNRHLSERLEL
jgi:hypothetical protein